jgi:hypothetical protein
MPQELPGMGAARVPPPGEARSHPAVAKVTASRPKSAFVVAFMIMTDWAAFTRFTP